MNMISQKSLTFSDLERAEGSLWASRGVVFGSDLSVINVNTEEQMLVWFTAHTHDVADKSAKAATLTKNTTKSVSDQCEAPHPGLCSHLTTRLDQSL